MKYAVVKVSNGSFAIHAEGFTDIDKAKVNYFNLCATLWNTASVIDASAMIVDEQLGIQNGYYEHITHEATTEE